MADISVKYLGDLRCTASHASSGTELKTDAKGDKAFISPVGVLESALGTCTASMIGLFASRHNINVDGMNIDVTVKMEEATHKITTFVMDIKFATKLSDEEIKMLAPVAKSCPVAKALDPSIQITHNFSC